MNRILVNNPILAAPQIEALILQLAAACADDLPPTPPPVLVGIRTRGVPLARRLSQVLQSRWPQHAIVVGALDITFFRDDLQQRGVRTPHQTDMPRDLTHQPVVLVDDVIFRGRTVQAALEALKQFGRPQFVRLAVLIDRGHRQLPIQPDYVGMCLTTQLTDVVRVHLQEEDGEDGVFLEQTQDL
jgi:pyrimidine operon attenuation protein/uracil phosphoribosyltransferase